MKRNPDNCSAVFWIIFSKTPSHHIMFRPIQITEHFLLLILYFKIYEAPRMCCVCTHVWAIIRDWCDYVTNVLISSTQSYFKKLSTLLYFPGGLLFPNSFPCAQRVLSTHWTGGWQILETIYMQQVEKKTWLCQELKSCNHAQSHSLNYESPWFTSQKIW